MKNNSNPMLDLVVHRCRLHNFMPFAIQCLAVNNTHKNPDVAVARNDGSVEIWCSKSWYQKLVIPGHPDRSIESLIWIDNELYSSGLNGDITRYELSSGKVAESIDSYGGAVWCMAYSAKYQQLAVGCEDGSVRLFSTAGTQLQYIRSLDRQEERILSIDWNDSYPDEIVTGSANYINFWNIKSGSASRRIMVDKEMRKVEPLIWSVVILKDFVIVSGDSYGRVQFWNGANGTLLESYHSHKADVLTLCANTRGNKVYASGIDPHVVEFACVNVDGQSTWVKGQKLITHSHDVKSIAVTDNMVISGGTDTDMLVRYQLQKSYRIRKVKAYPSKRLVSVSTDSNLVLFQYPEFLEVWSLGAVNEIKQGTAVPGDKLQLEKNVVKVAQIKAPSSDSEQISCSSISPCGNWVALSTASGCRLYKINVDKAELQHTTIERIKCKGLAPSQQISFSCDSTYLLTVSTDQRLTKIKLDSGSSKAVYETSIPLRKNSCVSHLMSTSPDMKYVVIANLDSDIDVYDTKTSTYCHSLPRYLATPTALSFSTDSDTLMVAYDDMEVFEYSLQKKMYTQWTRQMVLGNSKRKLIPSLRKSKPMSSSGAYPCITKINQMKVGDKNVTMFIAADGIYILERNEESNDHLTARFCDQFLNILSVSSLAKENYLLVVEQSTESIRSQLPPQLFKKKFGT